MAEKYIIKCRYLRNFVFIFITCLIFSDKTYSQSEIHPFILYTSNDTTIIKSRLSSEPYSDWWNKLRGIADGIIAGNVSWQENITSKRSQAQYAKYLAFAYMFSSPSSVNYNKYAEQAALSLYYMPESSYSYYFSSSLEISESALMWAEAYDILEGAGYGFDISGLSGMRTVIRNKLSCLRDYMADNFKIGLDFPSAFYSGSFSATNHHVKLYSSLAVLSLAIYNEQGSSADFSLAEARMKNSLQNLIPDNDSEGCWVEGPGYFFYSMEQHIPAFTAFKNINLTDYYMDAHWQKMHLWIPEILMPDGYTPPFDDSDACKFSLGGILYSQHVSIQERDLFLWAWKISGMHVPDLFLPDYISQFDNSAPVYENPEGMGKNTVRFSPGAGYARFRDSWENDAVYLFLLSENGKLREKGFGHEHPDPNSIILHAFGELLLLDSGYGGWTEHGVTRHADNHNIILVDGKGPSPASISFIPPFWSANGSDGYLTEYFSSEKVSYAQSKTNYESTDFLRNVIYPGRQYFFIYDSLYSGINKQYSLLLHGNGGGMSGGNFALKEDGAEWSRNNATLKAVITGSSEISFTSSEKSHAVYRRTPMNSHTMLEASMSGSEGKFLTLLYPYTGNGSGGGPEITRPAISGGRGIKITSADTVEYGAFRIGNEIVSIADEFDNIHSESEFIYCRLEKGKGLKQFFMKNGSFCVNSKDTVVKVSGPVAISLDYSNPMQISGYIQTAEPADIILFNIEPSEVFFNNRKITYIKTGNKTVFNADGEGELKILLSQPFPVELISFKAEIGKNNFVALEWETASEINNYGFIIERRLEKTEFRQIGFVPGYGTSNIRNSYSFTDTRAGYGKLYYRLKQVDFSGNHEYSRTVVVENRAAAKKLTAEFFPNPFNSEATLRVYNLVKGEVKIGIYGISGKLIKMINKEFLPAGYHDFRLEFDSRNLYIPASGLYILRISTADEAYVKKISLLK